MVWSNDSLISRGIIKFEKFLHGKRYGSSHVITLEITSFCNCRCIWCPMQNFHKHKLGSMKLDQFQYIIKTNREYFISNNIKIEPYFRGEPLLHPNFFDMMKILKDNNILNNGINTNLSVKIDITQFLRYPMPILVNIGGITKEVHEKVMRGSNFELVINNLKTMFQLGIPVNIKMNPTKMNIYQLGDLPRFVESLGGTKKCIIPYTTGYPIPATATKEEIDDFFKNVVSSEVDPFLRFSYDLSKSDKSIKTKYPGCHHLQDVIFFNGQYSICCHDQLQKINWGSVFKQSVREIRESNKYKNAVLKAHECSFNFCKDCN